MTRSRRGPLPADFGVSERVREWALTRQIMASYVAECCEAFVSHAKANGAMHCDWDEALMTWIRKEMKFHPKTPWRVEPQDRICRWTNRGTEPRCPAPGEVHVDGENWLCTLHNELYRARERAEADQARLQVENQ